MHRHLALVVSLLLSVGCTSSGEPGEEELDELQTPAAECERYLSCLITVAPQAYAAQLTLYGSESECWRTEQQRDNCGYACAESFDDIADQCACVGTSCEESPCDDDFICDAGENAAACGDCIIVCDRDGVCDPGEDGDGCSDCALTQACNGNGICEVGETSASCYECTQGGGCDGDGVCDGGETADGCYDCSYTCAELSSSCDVCREFPGACTSTLLADCAACGF